MLQRNALLVPDQPGADSLTYDAEDAETKHPAIGEVCLPWSALNVLVVPIDDTGFESTSAFGGHRRRSTAERAAAGS